MAKKCIVISTVRSTAKKSGVRVSAKGLDTLNAKVEKMIAEAAQKAKADRRVTIMPRDFEA